MRKVKVIIIAAVAVGLLAPFPATAEEDKQSFFPATLQTDGRDRIFAIGDNNGFGYSSLGRWPDMMCASTSDPICDLKGSVWGDPKRTIQAKAMLPICSAIEVEDCIQSVQISNGNGEFKQLIFERYMPDGYLEKDGNTFPADRARLLPTGSSTSIWTEKVDGKISDLKYLAQFSYQMNYDNVNDFFVINSVNLGIKPFKEIDGYRWDGLWTGNGQTGIQYEFRPNTTFQMTVHMSNKPAGWFKARMNDVSIDISPLSSTNNRVVVEGKAVTVPNFAVVRREAELITREAEIAKFFGYEKGVVMADPGLPEIFDYLEYWRNKLNDTASQSSSFWTLNSTRWVSPNKCLQDSTRVLGVVSTNAMGFDGNAPAFIDGFLNYRVAGFHFAADGKTENLGTYDLVMRSDAARCLYGFSNAPVSATISITGTGGASNVATTVVTEKAGWLKMKAAGFTFSEKNIKVKLTQATTAAKRVTITCVKGKISKKIGAVNPKCPAGFKRKY